TRPHEWKLVSSQVRTSHHLVEHLHELGLMGHLAHDKFVPHTYKFAPVAQRMSLLQGILDTDGCVGGRGDVEYTTVSPALADDVAFLVRSLGGLTRVRQKQTSGRSAYHLRISLPLGTPPFRLACKADRYAASHRRNNSARAIASVEADGEAEMVCIAVD